MKYSYQAISAALTKPNRMIVELPKGVKRECDCSDCAHDGTSSAVALLYCPYAENVALCKDALLAVTPTEARIPTWDASPKGKADLLTMSETSLKAFCPVVDVADSHSLRARLLQEAEELSLAATTGEILGECADVIHFVECVLAASGLTLSSALKHMVWKRSSRVANGKNKLRELEHAIETVHVERLQKLGQKFFYEDANARPSPELASGHSATNYVHNLALVSAGLRIAEENGVLTKDDTVAILTGDASANFRYAIQGDDVFAVYDNRLRDKSELDLVMLVVVPDPTAGFLNS